MKKLITLCLLTLTSVGAAQTTVEFWHSFGDAKRGDWIKARADEFNKAHPGVTVVPSYKGGYNDSLQATILASRQGKTPALVLIFEVGSQLAIDSGAFQPVSGIKNVDFSDYIKPVVNYYTIGGKVNSLPFNSSSPILYFNKDLMIKAGLDPKIPPTTFGAVLKACAKVDAAKLGVKCMALTPYGWFFEQWMSEQNVSLLNNGNGRDGRATAANINTAAGRSIFQFYKDLGDRGYLTNTANMASWHKLTGYYPVRSSSVTLLRKQGWFSSSPLQITAFNQLLSTTSNVASAGGLNGTAIQTRTIIEQGLQKVTSGQSVAAVAASTDAEVTAALVDYNKNFK